MAAKESEALSEIFECCEAGDHEKFKTVLAEKMKTEDPEKEDHFDANAHSLLGTMLHAAARGGDVRIVREILVGLGKEARFCSPNMASKGGCVTALHCAAVHDRPEVIRELLQGAGKEAGFTAVAAQNISGETALHIACKYARMDCVEALLESASADDRVALLMALDEFGGTALHTAASSQGRSNLDEMDAVRQQVSCIRSILRTATEESVVSKLIRVVDSRGFTCLHCAAFGNNSFAQVVYAILSNVTVRNRRFLVNAVSCDGYSALHVAARWIAAPDTISLLLAAGAKYGHVEWTNATTLQGQTALHLIVGACSSAAARGVPLMDVQEEAIRALLFPQRRHFSVTFEPRQRQPEEEEEREEEGGGGFGGSSNKLDEARDSNNEDGDDNESCFDTAAARRQSDAHSCDGDSNYSVCSNSRVDEEERRSTISSFSASSSATTVCCVGAAASGVSSSSSSAAAAVTGAGMSWTLSSASATTTPASSPCASPKIVKRRRTHVVGDGEEEGREEEQEDNGGEKGGKVVGSLSTSSSSLLINNNNDHNNKIPTQSVDAGEEENAALHQENDVFWEKGVDPNVGLEKRVQCIRSRSW